jgi:hypothetical protein
MKPEPCAECDRCAPLHPHPYLTIGTGKPATFAPLQVCEACLPAPRSTRVQGVVLNHSLVSAEKATQMDLFALAVTP